MTSAAISPAGRLHLEPGDGASLDPGVAQAFALGEGHGLLHLATTELP